MRGLEVGAGDDVYFLHVQLPHYLLRTARPLPSNEIAFSHIVTPTCEKKWRITKDTQLIGDVMFIRLSCHKKIVAAFTVSAQNGR